VERSAEKNLMALNLSISVIILSSWPSSLFSLGSVLSRSRALKNQKDKIVMLVSKCMNKGL
jgi:hypothetical protein